MRSFACCCVAAVLFALPGAARAEELPRDAIVADLGMHVVNVGVQRAVFPWLAAQVTAGLYGPWTYTGNVLGLSGKKQEDVVGGVVRGRLFFFPFQHAPEGLWISPFGQFGVAGSKRGEESVTGGVAALGVSAGYALLIRRKVLVSLGLGAQYHAARFPGGREPPSFAGFYPTLDINLGYAF